MKQETQLIPGNRYGIIQKEHCYIGVLSDKVYTGHNCTVRYLDLSNGNFIAAFPHEFISRIVTER